MAGSVVSVNVAEPREIEWLGRHATTSIWKEPVAGPVRVAGINLAGDDQADRRFHGGPDKAVYAYAREDYEWWSEDLGREVGNGAFGENLTVAGLDVTGAVVGEGLGAGPVSAGAPDEQVTVAVPERLSDTRLTRATPSLVFPCSSTRPSVVKHWMTVPSATGVPAGSITSALMTDTPPLAGMNGGLAKSVTVDPGAAVRIA